jgi:hypothetical protein
MPVEKLRRRWVQRWGAWILNDHIQRRRALRGLAVRRTMFVGGFSWFFFNDERES